MLTAAAILASCARFGREDIPEQIAAGGTEGGTEGGLATSLLRCGGIACTTPQKCCLPNASDRSPECVSSNQVCGMGVGELLCSDSAACPSGNVCCLSAERNGGQTGFYISRTYCTASAACSDGPLQHVACRLDSPQCPARTNCKPYRSDTNGPQTLPVDSEGYATCQ